MVINSSYGTRSSNHSRREFMNANIQLILCFLISYLYGRLIINWVLFSELSFPSRHSGSAYTVGSCYLYTDISMSSYADGSFVVEDKEFLRLICIRSPTRFRCVSWNTNLRLHVHDDSSRHPHSFSRSPSTLTTINKCICNISVESTKINFTRDPNHLRFAKAYS